jgi:NAD+ synthase (glutamine-hydrolysing)
MAKKALDQKVRIALAQINCTVGDLEGNRDSILYFIRRARKAGADIIAFPELAIPGYPPEDLLLKPKFIDDNKKMLRELTSSIEKDIVAIVGFVDKQGSDIFNAAAVLCGCEVLGVYRKMLLPNYGVFDEKRYFKEGSLPLVCAWRNTVFGVSICEDMWHEKGPTLLQARAGAKIIFNINASPYHMGKIKERQDIIRSQARAHHLCIVYTNLVGGQDELVFDGQSMIVDSKGKIMCRGEGFKEDLILADVKVPLCAQKRRKNMISIASLPAAGEKAKLEKQEANILAPVQEVYCALTLGLRDYVLKNGFKKVVIGLSGGVDSALVASLAVDALGKENVYGVFLPSRYSSNESETDASQLAARLGISFLKVSIEQIYKMYLLVLEQKFEALPRDATEENLQARIRGNILMAFSNKFGWLVLATGNKSEMSTGYATLYGDMAGGFAVIKDVPKTLVYKLAYYRNSLGEVIPERVLTKAPTAELKPDQKDSDTLPPYEILDPILKAYVEEDKEAAKIVALGFDKEIVSRVTGFVDRSEYKRRQSPPGIKITPKAFGRDRRMPITSRYRG